MQKTMTDIFVGVLAICWHQFHKSKNRHNCKIKSQQQLSSKKQCKAN